MPLQSHFWARRRRAAWARKTFCLLDEKLSRSSAQHNEEVDEPAHLFAYSKNTPFLIMTKKTFRTACSDLDADDLKTTAWGWLDAPRLLIINGPVCPSLKTSTCRSFVSQRLLWKADWGKNPYRDFRKEESLSRFLWLCVLSIKPQGDEGCNPGRPGHNDGIDINPAAYTHTSVALLRTQH